VIEHGELAYPVANLRFTHSYVAAMAGVQAVGSELRTLAGDGAGMASRVPALRIDGFRLGLPAAAEVAHA